MSIVQLNMFDCDTNIQRNDYVYRQLEALQIDSTLQLGGIRVSRTEKFYVVAKEAEFFSFGTNDLTQMTMGFSRDDAGKFLGDYVSRGIYSADPFQQLDQTGVGKLVEMGTKLGRKTRKHLKVGICGEHGGEPSSIDFCHRVGMNYVSCSPFRVPIARLAAAQASVRNP